MKNFSLFRTVLIILFVSICIIVYVARKEKLISSGAFATDKMLVQYSDEINVCVLIPNFRQGVAINWGSNIRDGWIELANGIRHRIRRNTIYVVSKDLTGIAKEMPFTIRDAILYSNRLSSIDNTQADEFAGSASPLDIRDEVRRVLDVGIPYAERNAALERGIGFTF